MKQFLSGMVLGLVAFIAFSAQANAQEGLAERLAQLEANNNMILSKLTAHKASIDVLSDRMGNVEAKLDTLIKSSGVQVTPVSNWAGDPVFTTTRSTMAAPVSSWSPVSSAYTTSSYSMMSNSMMGYGAPRRGLFGGRLRAGGNCANGMCGG